ncbi:MAG: hypothetical protein GQ468_02835 [Candidatus Scalindua sp.]|nr:hypothetical protein [Candidatus Scalindua sp.]
MNETSEMWKAHGNASKERREDNRDQSTKLLTEHEIAFEVKNYGAHLIVQSDKGIIDFWPGTGKWKARKANKYRRGVFELLKYIGKNERTN